MANNSILSKAKNAKNDEFYTQWADIEKEIQAYIEFNPDVFRDKTILCPADDPEWSNFTKFFALHFAEYGLKKLISTSYAPESKPKNIPYQISMFEQKDPKFDAKKTRANGKIFVLDRSDVNKDGKIDIDDLKWDYMNGDGDFRSEEVLKLRDEADIIVTNPPFSLFREFLSWITEANKQFLIIGNKNAIILKEVFPMIQNNKIWIGYRNINQDIWFIVPDGHEYEKEVGGVRIKHIMGCWYTNLDHGRHHQEMPLMSMSDNLKFSKHKEIKGKAEYEKYDNYDAIEIPFTDAIPSDYNGVMGVPVTFLDKYCPTQFEIIWQASGNTRASAPKDVLQKLNYRPHPQDRGGCAVINGVRQYSRVFIKHKSKGAKK